MDRPENKDQIGESSEKRLSGTEPMLDLPLGPPRGETGRDRLGRSVSESSAERPARPRLRPTRRGRRTLLVALLLLLVAALAIERLTRQQPSRAAARPEILNFGPARLESEAVEDSMLIVNQGERTMAVRRIEVSEDGGGDFRLLSEDCSGRSLSGGQSCTVLLQFQPRGMGPRVAGLEVEGQFENSPAHFSLVGRGIAPLVEADRAEIDFARRRVGGVSPAAELLVSNPGTAALSLEAIRIDGDGAGDFEQVGDRCSGARLAPGENCELRLRFRPLAAGPRRARLLIVSNAARPASEVRLEGVGEWSGPSLEPDVPAIDLGDVRVGAAPVRRPVLLTNRDRVGVSGIRASLVPPVQDLSLEDADCRRTLEPGDSCRLEIAFAPSREGEVATALRIRRASVEESLELPISGRGVSARLVVRQKALEFEPLRVGRSSDGRAFAVANVGTASAEIEALAIGGPDARAFALRNDGCTGGNLEPGAECAASVVFSPRREGPHRASLEIRPEPDRDQPRVALGGTGVAPRLQVDRELLEFGEVRRTAHRDAELRLSNSGTTGLALQRLELAGEATADYRLNATGCPSGGELAPGTSCTVRIQFAPSAAEGRRNARLVLSHDGLSGPTEVPLGGTALPPPIPRLRASPAALDFGPQPVGERSAILTLTASNVGSGRLEFRDFAVVGTQGGDFYIVPATCEAAPFLVPGSNCAVGIRFVPSAPGPRRARLVIRSNSAEGALAIDLEGEGLGSGS